MKKALRPIWALWVVVVLMFVGTARFSFATGNFVTVSLAKGVSIALPRNWVVLSNNQRVTLDSCVQAKRELAGALDPQSDLNFAANYYDEQDKTAGIFNIRYYPEQTVTQAESRAATPADTKELDDALHAEITAIQQQFGMQLLSWMGTTKQDINGTITFVTEYRRAGIRGGAPFRVRLVRVLSAGRSFTVTLSYREDQGLFLKPITDRVMSSLKLSGNPD